MIPCKIFFTKGVGRHKERLASFELALRDAGIEKFNLVSVSSILPPNCKIITREKGLPDLKPGQIVHIVLARNETNEANRIICSSIGCAIPADSNTYGYLSEHHAFGETDEQAGEYVEDLAASMLATTLGIEFDTDKNWSEREQEFKASGKIIRTRNITQSAMGKKELWTTTVAAAVFCEYAMPQPTFVEISNANQITQQTDTQTTTSITNVQNQNISTSNQTNINNQTH